MFENCILLCVQLQEKVSPENFDTIKILFSAQISSPLTESYWRRKLNWPEEEQINSTSKIIFCHVFWATAPHQNCKESREKSLKQYFTDFSLQNDCVLSRWGCCSESEEICQLWLDTAVSVKYEILADYDCWQQLLFESVSSKLWQQKIWRYEDELQERVIDTSWSDSY